MAIIFWPLHVLIPTSITISFTLFPFCPAISLPFNFSVQQPGGIWSILLCWRTCSEKRKVLFLFFSFFLFFILRKGLYIVACMLFTLINNPWALWRGCCKCISVRKRRTEFSVADGRGEQREAFCQSTQPWHNHFSVSQTDPDDSIYMLLIFSESFRRRCVGGCCSFYNIACTAMLLADAFQNVLQESATVCLWILLCVVLKQSADNDVCTGLHF